MRELPNTFLGLADCDFATARYAILPIPYDATTSYSTGTREGPQAIIHASRQLEDFDPDLRRDSTDAGVVTLAGVEPDVGGPEATCTRIRDVAREIVDANKFLLSLGGEHSVTGPLVAAVQERYPKLSVLQIDAHADLRNSYQGSPFSHACVMRRVHDLGAPAVGVGIRSYSEAEAHFIAEHDKQLISARDCHERDDWLARALEPLTNEVYITIDIDGFDPAYAPGTGTPEPGGLDWFQVTALLNEVAAQKRIVAADVVEVRPLGENRVTEFLGARLAYRLIGLTAHRDR